LSGEFLLFCSHPLSSSLSAWIKGTHRGRRYIAFLSRINRPEGLMVCKAHIFIFAGILFRGLETEVLTVFHSL